MKWTSSFFFERAPTFFLLVFLTSDRSASSIRRKSVPGFPSCRDRWTRWTRSPRFRRRQIRPPNNFPSPGSPTPTTTPTPTQSRLWPKQGFAETGGSTEFFVESWCCNFQASSVERSRRRRRRRWRRRRCPRSTHFAGRTSWTGSALPGWSRFRLPSLTSNWSHRSRLINWPKMQLFAIKLFIPGKEVFFPLMGENMDVSFSLPFVSPPREERKKSMLALFRSNIFVGSMRSSVTTTTTTTTWQ